MRLPFFRGCLGQYSSLHCDTYGILIATAYWFPPNIFQKRATYTSVLRGEVIRGERCVARRGCVIDEASGIPSERGSGMSMELRAGSETSVAIECSIIWSRCRVLTLYLKFVYFPREEVADSVNRRLGLKSREDNPERPEALPARQSRQC